MSVGSAPAARVTLLNPMVDADIGRAIAAMASWGLRDLDLRDQLFGKAVVDLDDGEAGRIADLAGAAGMDVHCLSTGLFFDDVARGEAWFRERHLARIPRLVAVARILRPRLVRLLIARSVAPRPDGFPGVDRAHPWLMPLYGEAIDALAAAGLRVTIENEVHGCVVATPDDFLAFFARLERHGSRLATWDVQNLWHEGGERPSLATWGRLRHLVGYVHVKGGRHDPASGDRLRWSTSLADASWPVAEVARAAAPESPVICINPSHGERLPGYDYAGIAERDVRFLVRALAADASISSQGSHR